MRANGRHPTTLKWSATIGVILLSLGTAGCSNPNPLDPEVDALAARGRPGQANEMRFSGTIDMVWPGGKGMNAPDDDRFAQASLVAFPGVEPGRPGSGNFAYRVITSSPPEDCGSCHEDPPAATDQHPYVAEGMLHREIGVQVYYVDIHGEDAEVRFLGRVVSDTKPCGGTGHDDGGCSHDDGTDHDDGGCSHDDGTDHDEGGCSHDDGTDHDDGGCSHDDGSTGGHGEPGGSGGSGSHPNGSDCRIGQVVLGWAYDAGKSRTESDRISWKWFYPDAPKILQVDAAIASEGHVAEDLWPCKLCEKEITGGNLKLHK
jgi:hypothetical protein